MNKMLILLTQQECLYNKSDMQAFFKGIIRTSYIKRRWENVPQYSKCLLIKESSHIFHKKIQDLQIPADKILSYNDNASKCFIMIKLSKYLFIKMTVNKKRMFLLSSS